MHPPERTRSTRFDISKTSVRLARLTHGSSRDTRGEPVQPAVSVPGESETEEWWFDVRPKGVGKTWSRTVDELCSESFESSKMVRSIRDTCGCVTADLSEIETFEVCVQAPQKQQVSTTGTRTFGRQPDARQRNSPLPSSRLQKARAVAVSPGTHETLVTLETVSLTESFPIPSSAPVSPVSSFFLSGRLAQLHLQAEHKKRRTGIIASLLRDSSCMVSSRWVCEVSSGASTVDVDS